MHVGIVAEDACGILTASAKIKPAEFGSQQYLFHLFNISISFAFFTSLFPWNLHMSLRLRVTQPFESFLFISRKTKRKKKSETVVILSYRVSYQQRKKHSESSQYLVHLENDEQMPIYIYICTQPLRFDPYETHDNFLKQNLFKFRDSLHREQLAYSK